MTTPSNGEFDARTQPAPSSPAAPSPDSVARTGTDVLTVVDLVRSGRARTRQDLARETGMGRNTVSHLLRAAEHEGLVVPAGTAPSTGGRAPDTWRFHHETGTTLVACLHTALIRLAVTDLAGNPHEVREVSWRIASGPEETLARLTEHLSTMSRDLPAPAWSAGISLPGPIDHATGRPVSPPIMPGWDGFDVVGRLTESLGVPVATDNDVNAMVLGHAVVHGGTDVLYLQMGTGIGAGLLSNGRLHRGADGAAGDIGHVRVPGHDDMVCRCGRTGCLEAVAGGWALVRDGLRLAGEGLSPHLREVRERNGTVTLTDIVEGVRLGDTECITLVVSAASAIGDALAMVVSFFNPGRIVMAGPVPQGCPMFRTVISRIVSERALDLATGHLEIEVAERPDLDELRGCARMAVDTAFTALGVSGGPYNGR